MLQKSVGHIILNLMRASIAQLSRFEGALKGLRWTPDLGQSKQWGPLDSEQTILGVSYLRTTCKARKWLDKGLQLLRLVSLLNLNQLGKRFAIFF